MEEAERKRTNKNNSWKILCPPDGGFGYDFKLIGIDCHVHCLPGSTAGRPCNVGYMNEE